MTCTFEASSQDPPLLRERKTFLNNMFCVTLSISLPRARLVRGGSGRVTAANLAKDPEWGEIFFPRCISSGCLVYTLVPFLALRVHRYVQECHGRPLVPLLVFVSWMEKGTG